MNINKYQKRTSDTAVYPQENASTYLPLGLASEAGEIADIFKRAIRNHNGIITPEAHQELCEELGDLLWYAAQLATFLDVSMTDILQANIDKLAFRKQKGTLKTR